MTCNVREGEHFPCTLIWLKKNSLSLSLTHTHTHTLTHTHTHTHTHTYTHTTTTTPQVHVLCARWTPELDTWDAKKCNVRPILDIKNVKPERLRLYCTVCKKRGVGVCTQCTTSRCTKAVHPMCVIKSNPDGTVPGQWLQHFDSNDNWLLSCPVHAKTLNRRKRVKNGIFISLSV